MPPEHAPASQMRRDELTPPVRDYADNLKEQLKQSFQELKITSLDELAAAARAGAIPQERLAALQEQMAALKTAVETNKLPTSELEERLNLKDQYERQKNLLGNLANELAIDGRIYPLPAYEMIKERLEAKQEIIKGKIEQGFTKLLLVPFGLPLDKLIGWYKEELVKHHQQGTLYAARKDPAEQPQPLTLDTTTPVWVWDQYQQADTNGNLLYYPQEFSATHQGKTKQELIDAGEGWHILLIEELPNIPRATKGITIGGRPQLEANQTPTQYLTSLKTNPAYAHEQGWTSEDWLVYARQRLEETNEVTDDYQGNGSLAYLLGGYFPSTGDLPCAYWSRVNSQAILGRADPGNRVDYYGARAAVGV